MNALESSFLHGVTVWVVAHPALAGLAVFAVAMAESFALVGLLVPGAAAMIAFGALVGQGSMDLASTVAWAVAGAVAGDGASYWLGRHFRGGVRRIWPFRRHPQWLAAGERFMLRHGGKSVLFGRFVGPVRAVVPLVAGMTGMPPRRFLAVNVGSALLWAPAYLAPGLGVVALLRHLESPGARLALLLLLLLASVALAAWLVRHAHAALVPVLARHLARRGASWTRSLLALGLAAAACLGFLAVLEDVLTGDPLVQADAAVYQFLQTFRTPWGDRVMIAITALGGSRVVAGVSAWTLLWLLWRRHWRAGACLLGSVAGGVLSAAALKWILHVPRPDPGFGTGLSTFAFPSGHATVSVTLYGFLAVLLAAALRRPARLSPYTVAAVAVTAIAFSRLYLGVHWLSDVLGGLLLGLAWTALFGALYRLRTSAPGGARSLLAGLAAVILIGGAWQLRHDLGRYALHREGAVFIIAPVSGSPGHGSGASPMPRAPRGPAGGGARPGRLPAEEGA